ncbi:MAG: sigma-70 family RNA polymerase sigma factor [Kiritimatiellia bacterium]
MREDNNLIKVYLREIGQVPLLTAAEELELAERVQKGDEQARQHMVKANLRLVVKIAQGYANYGLPLLDLISEGNMGLMKAVERFDPTRGAKLSTYAAWWIKQSIKRALANQSKTIRLPAHLVDKVAKMRRHIQRLTAEFKREPNNAEIAEAMGVEPGQIAHWRNMSTNPASIDAPVSDDGDAEFVEMIKDERQPTAWKEINDRQVRADVFRFMDRLDDRERDILRYRYGLDGVEEETLEVVGERFRITRERVRQIQNSALKKLRDMLDDQDAPNLEPAGVSAD